jgi:hypothetical protein
MTLYRAHISWLEGTTLRTVTGHDTIDMDEVIARTTTAHTAIQDQLMLRVHSESGTVYAIRGDLLTSIRYQPVEVASTDGPETTEADTHNCCADHWSSCTRLIAPDVDADDAPDPLPIRAPGAQLPGHCCTDPSPCRDEAARAVQALPTAHDLAAQEARHPGLSRILNALVTQLPPDDPDRCAQTLAAMDAAGPMATSAPDSMIMETITPPEYVSPFKTIGHDGPHFPIIDTSAETMYPAEFPPRMPRNGARDCPCWPGQCTCDVKPSEPEPEHGGRDGGTDQ